MENTIYFVSIDTRGLPALDIQKGFEELACSREYFSEQIDKDIGSKCVVSPIAEMCGLTKYLTVYFHECIPGRGRAMENAEASSYRDVQDAWSEFFPVGQNNPGATLLTIDPGTGYPRCNVQGVAFAIYDDGQYPLSKEQVWGLCELANEAKDVYFCDEWHEGKGKYALGRWCNQYRDRAWGPSTRIYEPRQMEKRPPTGHGSPTHFNEAVLI